MGKGSCPHCVKISLCLVWPTKCLNRYEHLNIDRHPSKARFPGSFKKGEDLGLVFPQSTSQLAWNTACPLRSPPSPGPISSATAPAWYLGIYILGYFMLNIRRSAEHLAPGKLLETGRPFPPNLTRSYRIKFPSFTCSLSSGMPCLPLGQRSHSCSYTAQPFRSQPFPVDLGLEHMESWNHPEAVAVTCQDREMTMGRGEGRE